MRCGTRSGPYRCMHDVGHKSDCEQLDLSGLAIASGRRLDELGAAFKVWRDGADDPTYRSKIWERATS